MVIDFSNGFGDLYIDNQMPTYVFYRMRLISLYNNKGLDNQAIGDIPLTWVDSTDRWTKFRWSIIGTPNEDITDEDIAGYYRLIIEGTDDKTGDWTQFSEYPTKVRTQWDENPVYKDTQYDSDNEDNEQYVYYRS